MESKSPITEPNKRMKILWNSNAPYTPTGYGTATNALTYRILKMGYDIRIAANYGLEGSSLEFNGLPIYPHLFSEFGDDALSIITDAWHPDVLITLYDIWIGNDSRHSGKNWFTNQTQHWIPWIPIDHYPIPEPVARQAKLAWKAVAMSKFGQKELQKIGKAENVSALTNAFCIPHGAETQTLKPLDKAKCKEWLNQHAGYFSEKKTPITADTFIVGTNSANKDPFRKDFYRMLKAYKLFLDANPDARKDSVFYLHTWISYPGGFDLPKLARTLGIHDNVRNTLIYDMFCALPPDCMAKLYNAWDINMLLSRGEGFGIPLIESQACGTPCIATDYTAMTELVEGHGWLVPLFGANQKCPSCGADFHYHEGAKVYSHLLSDYGLPDEYKAADALEDAYNHPEKTAQYGKASRDFAVKGYDYETVVTPLWLDILDEASGELGFGAFGITDDKKAQFASLFTNLKGVNPQ